MRLKRFVFILFLLLGLTACDKYSGTNMLDSVLKTGEPYFAIQFNKIFAQRFSLPVSKAITLSDNLQAIAVEINKVNDRYICDLHLYVDDNLDVYKPGAGNYFSIKPVAAYYFIKDISDSDYAWNVERIHTNKMRARFDSTLEVNPQLRFTRTLSFNRFHRSFLPGLSLVSLNTHCGIFNPAYYPANIWIQKQDVGDYLVGNDGREEIKHPEKNQRFPIPMQLIEQIQPYIEIAEKHNTERL